MTTKFPQRKIGDDLVSAVGLGCMGMSMGANLNDEESLKVLTLAADLGITLWNTSDHYGPFTNQRLIGRWFKETGRRDEIFLTTKFGLRFSDDEGNPTAPRLDGSPEWVARACTEALDRLQTDHIDVFILARADPAVPVEHTVTAMAELKNAGKIRHLGLSECSARTLRRACAIHPIAAAEMEYSPFALEIESSETDFLRTARDLNVSILGYAPLGRGFLTGAIRSRADLDPSDPRLTTSPRYAEENFAANFKLVEALEAIAHEKGCRPGQLALAWVLAQGDDIVPIPGTKRVKYLVENADAVKVTLDEADNARIRRAIDDIGGMRGARYPPAFMHMCFGDTPELEE